MLSTTIAGLGGGVVATLLGSDSATAQTELSLSISGDNADLGSGESVAAVVLDCEAE